MKSSSSDRVSALLIVSLALVLGTMAVVHAVAPAPPPVAVASASGPGVVLGAGSPLAASRHTFTFHNACTEPIWVGDIGNAGFSPLEGGGWKMDPGAVRDVTVPVGWGGRFWPRTACTFDAKGLCSGNAPCCATGSCLTSDDKTFGLSCAFSGTAPVGLTEVTLDAAGGLGPYDVYDTSFVDGWSVPLAMVAKPGTFNPTADPGLQAPWCTVSGCASAPTCPPAYAVAGSPGSCWSPCQVAVNAGSADATKLCCSCSLTSPITCPAAACAGAYGCSPYSVPANPTDMTCNPWNADPARAWDATAQGYIADAHTGCPGVYAWQFDDSGSTYNCRKTGGEVDYDVTFCPGP